jgi:hypothetical protein
MCSPGGVVLPVPVQASGFPRRERCHTLKATRLAAQKELAHDARAALDQLRMLESRKPAQLGRTLLRRSSKLAQIRSVHQTGRPGRGRHGDGAGHASVGFRLRLIPEASQFVPEQPVFPESKNRQTPV